MINIYRLTSVSLLFMLLSYQNVTACGFDFVGSCASAVRFTANGAPKDYFVTTCAYGNSFAGNSIGTNLTALQLSSTTTVTWESCTNILQESNAFIRVFSNAANKGAFLKVPMSQQSLNTNSPPYRTRTYSNNLSIDLLVGLAPNTTYTVEMYYQIGVDSDGNSSVDETKVYDNNGSYFAATFQTGNIAVNSGYPLVVSPVNPLCNGGTGSATVSASGGTAPYTFAWSNGTTGASVSGLRSGFYSVTATDATAAKSIQSFSIAEPSAINASLSTTNTSCGGVNGSIVATVSGGTSPYTYAWSNNATTGSLTSLQAGVYTVTVTDKNACKGSASSILTENCGGNGTYCASAGSPWNEWLARVQFNTLDNASEKTRPDRYLAGYSDWSDKATTVAQGASYPLSITPGLSWSGLVTNLYFRAWIDFNKNGLFEDNEKVFEKNATSLAVSSTVSIPSTALLGATRMRISMKKDSFPTACESFAAGEVEDYGIVITGTNSDPCATDITKPVLSSCPSNMGLTTTTTCASATWIAPTATDNCTTAPSVTSNFASGFCFPIGTTNVVYTAKDAFNNTATCSFNVVVTAGTNTSDIGLTVTTVNPTFGKWSTVNFKVTVRNNGTTPFSNVKIEFKYPTGTVNGGAVVASLGVWEEWCAGGIQCYTWTIPSLAANAVATLDAPLFVLDVATPITATAKLLTSTPVDNITANNTGSVTINPISGNAQFSEQQTSLLVPMVIKKISPTFTEGDVFVEIESRNTQEVSFFFSDALGKVVKVDKRAIEKGNNIVTFDVLDLPRGVYFIMPKANMGHSMPTKFVRL